MDLTYHALPFPLPARCQLKLAHLARDVRQRYLDPETKNVPANRQADYRSHLEALDAYVAEMRQSIGVEITSPPIRAHQ